METSLGTLGQVGEEHVIYSGAHSVAHCRDRRCLVRKEVKNSEVLVESFQRMVSQAKNTTCVACVLQMIICPAFIVLQPWPWLRNTMSLLEKPLSLEVQRLSLPKMVAGKNLADCKSIRTVDSLLLWRGAQTKVPTESCQQDQGVHYEKAVVVSATMAPSCQSWMEADQISILVLRFIPIPPPSHLQSCDCTEEMKGGMLVSL